MVGKIERLLRRRVNGGGVSEQKLDEMGDAVESLKDKGLLARWRERQRKLKFGDFDEREISRETLADE